MNPLPHKTLAEKQLSLWCIGLLVFMNLSGIGVPVMEPDAALYAGIGKHMALHHDYWNLYADGRDWLDKPHFPFWMMALSYGLLGINTVAYKLPALLFLLTGAVYTYLFARDLYGEKAGRWAVCILLTAQHLVISNNDVRAEPYLTGLIIGGVYHFYRSQGRGFSWHLVLGALFTACAVMTKGPFALVPVGSALAGQFLFTRQWKQLLHWRWLAALALVAVFITPELYALYRQFDVHPEKVVFGRTGVSGIRFFFWDSQFGRFMNTGPIKGKGDPFFFFHTLLWAFLPWSILLYVAVAAFFRGKVRREYYCISGALATFALFSASRFQLPHYLNIIFPFFAILTAGYVLSLRNLQFFRVTQYIITGIIAVAVAGLAFLYRPAASWWALVLIAAAVVIFILLPGWLQDARALVFYRTCAAAFGLNVFLNGLFYPDVLRYQGGSAAAFYANRELRGMPVAQWAVNSYALEFYLEAGVLRYDSLTLRRAAAQLPVLVFTTPEGVESLQQQGYQCRAVQEFAHFSVTRLDMKFVNYMTREAALGRRLLVWVTYGGGDFAARRRQEGKFF